MATVTDNETIHEIVKKSYAARVTGTAGGCCGGGTKANQDEAAVKMGYSAEDVDSVPEGANLGLGCGAPLAIAAVRPGETVLDLGSGAGFDAFLAARAVGSSGRVIGVDMTPEMVSKARENAASAGFANIDFRRGQIESLPVEDGEVDVVISNCVINLSPDKPAVFREADRAPKPGGRIAVSDIVLTAELPEVIAKSLAAYVGCVAGAWLLEDYLAAVEAAGFRDVEVAASKPAVEALSGDDPLVRGVLDQMGAEKSGDLEADLAEIASRVVSAQIVARKPS